MTDRPMDAARVAWQVGDLVQTQLLVDEALTDDPDDLDALMLAANVAFACDDIAGARGVLEHLARLQPNDIGIQTNLGHCLLALDDTPAAERAFLNALRVMPNHARALDGLGVAKHRQGQYREAKAAHRLATEADPDMASAWCNLGIALTDLGDYPQADTAFDQALTLEPDDPKSQFNSAIVHLMRGDYATGWPLYEARLKLRDDRPRVGRRWRGEKLSGETIFLFPEQGYGDFIQFSRYLPEVIRRAQHVVLAVPDPLIALIRTQAWNIECVSENDLVEAAYWCPLMSLPGVLGITLDAVTGAAYMKADDEAVARWQQPGDSLSVGLVSSGNPNHRRDRDRSMPIDQLCPLFDVSGIAWRSLQVSGSNELADIFASIPDFVDFAGEFDDFADTAAAIANLDLVISVDTAVLHLAGALGVPAWGLLPFVPDWRWGAEAVKTPWYDSLRLFRQPELKDWTSVIEDVRGALTGLLTDD